ncbi:MAG: glycosyl transferase group 1 [Hyphomicrobiales bacterium]|nr:glycosyl transferase group 1 [Hyphomicrobiales bacterium]
MASALTINGRFLTQSASGVQRYASQIVKGLDTLAAAGTTRRPMVLAVPPGKIAAPALASIPLRTVGTRGGYYWEQIQLPSAAPGPLLNLCNLGPVSRTDQVLCIHDANIFTDPGSYSRAFGLAYRVLQPLLVRRAARVATVSSFSARMLAKYLPVRAEDIAVLPNGHEHVREWDPSRSKILEGRRDRPFILLLGSKAKHKNADLILGLADALDSLGLDIYVAGGGGHVFAASEQRDRSNVVRLGFVTDDDLAALLGRAMCLAFPSWNEGFGLPILEAMALGCPVISSDRASMPEVGGRAAVYAAPDAPADWLSKISELLASPDRRQEMAGLGREQALRFSWKGSAEGYLDAIDRL